MNKAVTPPAVVMNAMLLGETNYYITSHTTNKQVTKVYYDPGLQTPTVIRLLSAIRRSE